MHYFSLFQRIFYHIQYTYFTHIAVSSTLKVDTNQVTRKTFNCNLHYSSASTYTRTWL